jgi:isopenicillin N synthase-like dioxygenase
MKLPVVDAGNFLRAQLSRDSEGAARSRTILAEELKNACHNVGMFYLVGHELETGLIDAVMAETAAFFATEQAEKDAIDISHASNFRGYGMLKNYRDWREQIHLGVEAEPIDTSLAHYWQLWGPNQWPSSEFKAVMLRYFAAIDDLSRTILTLLAESLDYESDYFTARMQDRPYLLMKAMSYLPQAKHQEIRQMGVTAHCDWSWLTFLIQDDVGGLEGQDISGQWHKVDPIKNAIVVNTGELLEIETGGYLRASPHRVINARIDRQRYSIPVFINPALDATITPGDNFVAPAATLDNSSCDEHVHKVIKPGSVLAPFVFGDSEYDRKALGIWCHSNECVTALK